MGRSFAEELPKHLETWVREGLISPESAEILLRRNQSAAGAAADAVKRKLLTVLAILCAALFSGGLILVIAHNWDMLSPFWRLSMAYLPLLAGLVFGGFVLRRHDGEPCWCEPAALWIGGGAASAIAIISQLYQISGSLNDYLFWLILLCVPLVWLFHGRVLALACSVATVVMAVSGADMTERSFLQAGLFFLLLAPWTLRLALTDVGRWGKIAGELMTLGSCRAVLGRDLIRGSLSGAADRRAGAAPPGGRPLLQSLSHHRVRRHDLAGHGREFPRFLEQFPAIGIYGLRLGVAAVLPRALRRCRRISVPFPAPDDGVLDRRGPPSALPLLAAGMES